MSNEIVIIAEALSSVYSTFVVTVYTATFSTSSSAGSVTGSSSSSTTSSYSTKISLLVFSVKVTFLVTLPSTSLSPSRSRALYCFDRLDIIVSNVTSVVAAVLS